MGVIWMITEVVSGADSVYYNSQYAFDDYILCVDWIKIIESKAENSSKKFIVQSFPINTRDSVKIVGY